MLQDWRNQLMEHGNFRQFYYLSDKNQEEWFNEISDRQKHLMLGVYGSIEVPGSLGQPLEVTLIIGVVGLTYLNWISRSAEASIYIAPEHSNKGYGTEALKALCKYGFDTVNLNRITAEIYAYNDRSIKLFEKLGFVKEGTLRQSVYRFGNYDSSYVYGLLRDDYHV